MSKEAIRVPLENGVVTIREDADVEIHIQLSIASSLKRIADSLSALGVDKVGLAGWIESVAFYAGQSFERGRNGR